MSKERITITEEALVQIIKEFIEKEHGLSWADLEKLEWCIIDNNIEFYERCLCQTLPTDLELLGCRLTFKNEMRM